MASFAKLTRVINSDKDDRINIFIHGYKSAPSSEQVKQLKNLIREIQPSGSTYLLLWQSGSWLLTAMVPAIRWWQRLTGPAKIFNPMSLVIDGILTSAMEAGQFKYYENRSEQLGRQLKQHISRIPNAMKRPINLIGHSLGARVIHTTLSHSDWSKYKLNDCVFLAGAADLEIDDWPKCLEQIQGQLHNGYSKHDDTLPLVPDSRKRVGMNPMPDIIIDGENKVVNTDCGKVKHTDYWNQLSSILPKVWPGFKQQ